MTTHTISNTRSVPVSSIRPSQTNPRKHFDPVALCELSDSIKQHGVLQPILVRHASMSPEEARRAESPSYEIVAGERRWRAAKAAGLEWIDVKIADLSDREALELQIIENLQRADLHPLEEADGYRQMMRTHGYSAEEVAEKIGKSKAYVYGRLKLSDLGSDARDAFLSCRITASVALLVARVATHQLQARLIHELLPPGQTEAESVTVRHVQYRIRTGYMLDLYKAPFPPDDPALLPAAGSCYGCPKRTGNQPEIFDDPSESDICTDLDCFALKKKAHLERLADAGRANGMEVIYGDAAKKIAPNGPRHTLVGDDYVDVDSRIYEGDHIGKTFREALGDRLQVTLVEDTRSGKLVESMRGYALRDALVAAGALPSPNVSENRQNERSKIAEKVAEETCFRNRLWANVFRRANDIAPETLAYSASRMAIDRLIVDTMWGNLPYLARLQMIQDGPGKSYQEKCHAMSERIAIAHRAELFLLSIEMAVSTDLQVDEFSVNAPPLVLTHMAEHLGIVPSHVRREIAAEKTGRPLETISTKEKPATSARQVKYRSPLGESWTGRGRMPNWVKAWIDRGNTLESIESDASTAPVAEPVTEALPNLGEEGV